MLNVNQLKARFQEIRASISSAEIEEWLLREDNYSQLEDENSDDAIVQEYSPNVHLEEVIIFDGLSISAFFITETVTIVGTTGNNSFAIAA